MAVLACYEKDGQPRCQLLAMALLLQAPGQDLTAEGQVDFVWEMLFREYGPHAAIVHNPNFESGCIKVQQSDTVELTRSEKTALSRFAVRQDAAQSVPPKDDPTGFFVEQVKTKRKTSVPTTTYMLVHSIPRLRTRWSAFSAWPRRHSAATPASPTSYARNDPVSAGA
ncbi:unnamed protein product [Phytophthora fragariaefolia]|uniref:Unnamed protein product n=1 Tax=Phytophthora fragariaefolia TaxID=1490495 RepID=A0A9W6Y6K6_9STRA|nr:unnamed protein product [Phytophthora fragariaefolia]